MLRRPFLTLASWFGAHRADQRDAHERDRARQRLAIGALIGLLAGWHALVTARPSALELALPLLSLMYGGYALFHWRVVLARAHAGVAAQYLFIVLDSVLTVLALAGAPTVMAPLYPVLMVQIVRCGMRYGMRTLWLAWGAAALSAAALLPFSAFWLDNPLLLRSFAVMMAVTPPLMGPLVRRLQDATAELRAAADADALTGLGNRRMLEQHIRLAQEHSARDGTMLALVLIDLDNFKRVNDTLGHAAGDLLLQRVAASLHTVLRAGDMVARIGGDEFVLLVDGLPVDSGPERALAIGQAAVAAIRGVAESLVPGLEVGASAGVCCWADSVHAHAEPEDLLSRADAGMYDVKRTGKSRSAAVPMDALPPR